MDPWEEYLPSTTASMPSLAVLDDRCRCTICKDYLQGPMMTLCGHTFCSICIRRALNADGRCPVCRSLEEESKLRKNLMIEEIVEAFLPFRTSLMQYAPTNGKPDEARRESDHNDARPTIVSDSNSDSALSDPPSSPPAARPRRSTRSSNSSSQTRSSGNGNGNGNVIPAGHIQCPICSLPIHQDKADYHVNRCLEGKATPPHRTDHAITNTAPGAQSSPYFHTTPAVELKSPIDIASTRPATPTTNSMKRMPKMSYAAMSDAKLRKAMVDMGINSSGNRAQLQRRCTEFIAMWNSNLDSKHPKSKKELIAEMRAWDRVQARPVQRATNEEIDSAHQSGKYDDSFNDLIAKARESLKKRKAVEREQSRESIQGENRQLEENQHIAKRQHTDSV